MTRFVILERWEYGGYGPENRSGGAKVNAGDVNQDDSTGVEKGRDLRDI